MKRTALAKLLVVTLAVVAITATGCRSKRPDKNITPIPGTGSGLVNPADETGGPLTDSSNTVAQDGVGFGNPGGQPIVTPISPTALGESDTIGGGVGDTSMDRIDINTPVDEDTQIWAGNTIRFDFDSSVVRPSEVFKLAEIINVLARSPNLGVKVEGHCDERGTEEYNRALGERRANSVRDHLIEAGVGPNQIRTLSYGEDQPEDLGHDEAAWAANRRAVFVLLRPR